MAELQLYDLRWTVASYFGSGLGAWRFALPTYMVEH
jgi:hypothetical protein